MQRVVFNGHYLTYLDDTMATWFEAALGWTGRDDEIDWMLVKVVMEWQGSATYGDVLDVDAEVSRWGTTSFDVAFAGTVGDRPVFTATITCVCVEPGVNTKTAVTEELKRTLTAPTEA